MRSQICLPGWHSAWFSRLSPDSSRPSFLRAFPHRMAATAGASQVLRRLIALAVAPLLLTLAQGELRAQAPGQGWPQYPQNGSYNGQYPRNQQSGYAQPSYAQPQSYGQQPYAQQSYPAQDMGYDQGYPPPEYGHAQPPAQPLTPEQLQQLVAPIALYPDTLVAQVLAAATYPAQVVGADHWLQAQGYASPDQIVAGADAQTWDPSVKALTAFPQVLAQMDRNLQWTTDLGNAYYNQPQDVLETVQVMRQRAQAAGTLQDTPQEAVSYNQGYLQLAPVNPEVVYVPAYNPWDVYGQPVTPYRNFSLLGSLASLAGSSPVKYGLGIAMSAFSHSSFGWMGWALNWLTQSVLFHQSNYYSHSTTVAHWANPRNGLRADSQRDAMLRLPDSYNRGQYHEPQSNYARPGNGYNDAPRQALVRPPVRNPENYAENRPYAGNRPVESPNRNYPAQPGNYGRSGQQAYNHLQPPVTMPARPQSYGRPGYGSGFYGESPQTYSSRPANPYASPQQAWRGAASAPQRGDFGKRSYPGDRSYSASGGRGFEESPAKPAHSGGFHLFGGGHNAEKSYGGGHAPKSYGGGRGFSKGHSGGGGHSGGHHGGGHHR